MRDALALAAALVKVRVLRRRFPLFVGWNITFRCNLDCAYCGARDARGEELDTPAVMAGLDDLWSLGTRWITFGGGEPLLRHDIGAIVRYAREKGFRTFVSTNGILLPRKIEEVRGVDHINLSLDGPERVHDAVRGSGAFAGVAAAMETCRREGISYSLQCVLSSRNLDAVEEVAEIAEEHATHVMYQPATQWLDSSTAPNPIAPPTEAYRAAIARAVQLKRLGKPVRNSFSGLAHLAHWPEPKGIWCGAGRMTCEIEPDGAVLACHQAQVGLFLGGKLPSGDVRARVGSMRLPGHCVQCWCAPVVELALLFSLRPEAIFNALRTMK